MRLLVFLSWLVLLFKAISCSLNGTAVFSCTRTVDGMNKLTVTYEFGTDDPVMSLYVADMPNVVGCRVNKAVGDTFIQLSLMPIDSTGVCGIMEGVVSPGPLAADAVFFLTKSTGNLLEASDHVITVPQDLCDFSNTTLRAVIIYLKRVIDVTGNPGDGIIKPQVPLVTLWIVHPALPDVSITTCVLGAAILLKFRLILPIGGGPPFGLHVLRCTVSSSPAGFGFIDLIQDSCVPAAGPIGSTPETGFTGDVNSPVDQYITLMTNKFDCARFVGAFQITVTCTVDFCTTPVGPTDPPNKCQEGVDSCAAKGTGPGRKRRDVGERFPNETNRNVAVTIQVGTHSDEPVINSNNNECPINTDNKIFIAVVAALGGLLLIAMAVTCYLASRLRLFARKVGKGIDNPSF